MLGEHSLPEVAGNYFAPYPVGPRLHTVRTALSALVLGNQVQGKVFSYSTPFKARTKDQGEGKRVQGGVGGGGGGVRSASQDMLPNASSCDHNAHEAKQTKRWSSEQRKFYCKDM